VLAAIPATAVNHNSELERRFIIATNLFISNENPRFPSPQYIAWRQSASRHHAIVAELSLGSLFANQSLSEAG
jgi:hypothetical protein